jgi:hypothetical protein
MKFKQSFGFGPRISTSSGAFEGRVRPFDLTSCFPNLVLLLVRCPVWASLGISHPYRSLYQFSNDTISLWDILGEGEVKSLAQLSTDHWKIHKRPLRVAIDEASWRFHNLSDAQVAAIRQKVPEANPIEKAIFWRVLKLMRMNIQPIFIFDGPSYSCFKMMSLWRCCLAECIWPKPVRGEHIRNRRLSRKPMSMCRRAAS